MPMVHRLLAWLACVALASCHLLINSDGLTGGGDAGACPSTHGPSMIDTGRFCIDSTEVTFGQYLEFIDAGVATSGQVADCAWNTSWVPENDPACPQSDPGKPVHCVDWCDAKRYCEWAGKRLCGRMGPGNFDDPEASEWMFACAQQSRAYPYGASFERGRCNTDAGGPSAPRAFPRCEGGFPGLFDMSGNLKEWEDFCEPGGATALCYNRGGSYAEDDETVDNSCRVSLRSRRENAYPRRGIRCCMDRKG